MVGPENTAVQPDKLLDGVFDVKLKPGSGDRTAVGLELLRINGRDRDPVAGVQVAVKDSSGKVLGQTETDKDGKYAFDDLPPGDHVLTLNPLLTGFLGQSVVGSLGPAGLTVNWAVSTRCAALAYALGGTGGGIGPGAAIIGTGVLLFIPTITCGTGNCDDDRGPASPTN
jgi:hypothetical protein